MATAAHTTETLTTPLQAVTFARQIETLAEDVGRLRRRVSGDEYAGHLVDRLAAHLEVIDAFLKPTAGELHRAGWNVQSALEHVDAQARHFDALFGPETR